MTKNFKLVFGMLLMAFLFVPGLLHYIKSHEQMRLELAHKDYYIAELKSNYGLKSAPVSVKQTKIQSKGSAYIDAIKFCIPKKV